MAPAGTAPGVVNALHAASLKALQNPTTLERMKAQGLEAVGSTPPDFSAKIKRDIDKWRRVFKEANIVMQ